MGDITKGFGVRLGNLIKSEWGYGGKKKLAEILHVRTSTISIWLAGRLPEGEYLIKIADIFGVTADFLLTGRSPWERDAYVAGKKVAEGTVKFDTLKEIAEADDETLKKVRAIMDVIRREGNK